MRAPPRRGRIFVLGVATLLAGLCVAPVSADREALAGRRLHDALRILQARGLRIVFSSELVTPEMRVAAEPAGGTDREVLDRLLAPHGLAVAKGPGGVLQVVRAKREPRSTLAPKDRVRPAGGMPAPAAPGSAPPQSFRERVTVIAPPEARDTGPAASSLAARDLHAFAGFLTGDPLRAVQALPRALGRDDFRSDLSVRASPYRHVGVVVEGVPAHWLQHAAHGRGDTGTISMLDGDVVGQASLLAGAYPRRHGHRLGAELDVWLREGSRAGALFRATAGRTNVAATGEGPIGDGARGSWLVAARKSHVEWPVGRSDHDASVFGFADVAAKIAHDVSATEQVSVALVGGRSAVERDGPRAFEFADGATRAAMATVAWRSLVGSATVVSQRVSIVAQAYSNTAVAGGTSGGGDNGSRAYRLDVTRALPHAMIEAGGHVQRIDGSRYGPQRGPLGDGPLGPDTPGPIGRAWWLRSAFAHVAWLPWPRLTVAPGLRLADSTLAGQRALDRWLQVEWLASTGLAVRASTGVSHQFAELDHVRGWTTTPVLAPERAVHLDLGVVGRARGGVRWEATVFLRRERDVLRAPDAHPRIVGGLLSNPPRANRYENALVGTARGIELEARRERETGLSGWIGYAYGHAHHTDASRAEAFRADFDQRHGVTAAAAYRTRAGTLVALTFRGGTDVPLPGYLIARDGRLFAGARRNAAVLPGYARLDARAERVVTLRGVRGLTLFAEVVNVLGRANAGPAEGTIRAETGEALGFSEPLFPRLLNAGVRVAF